MYSDALRQFVVESNRIEGIVRKPTAGELHELYRLLELERVTLTDIASFVGIYQPNARIRSEAGLNVIVGKHRPPPGGPAIVADLCVILDRANAKDDPYDVHCAYETLHPFTDGNGRSGRALWLWQITGQTGRIPEIGFLHSWYYQSLQHVRST